MHGIVAAGTRFSGNADGARRPANRIPWDDVQYFLELARKDTLLRAARRLGVSHTTVLRRIANLERCLDRKLFGRTQRGFVLTEAGWQLLEHAKAMECAADGIDRVGERETISRSLIAPPCDVRGGRPPAIYPGKPRSAAASKNAVSNARVADRRRASARRSYRSRLLS
jgi:DNA-binding transcriptional LysR family regulator